MTDEATPPDPPQSSGRGEVTVVGTAHVSHDSVAEVEETIEAERPDVVAVELDEGRYRQLQGEAPDDLDASDLLRGNTVFQLLAYWLLSYVQARMGERFDIKPGADMLAAVETAEGLDIDVALVDRDIQTTIQRFWARMTAGQKLRLVSELALGLADPLTLGVGVGGAMGLFVGVVAGAFAGPFLLPEFSGIAGAAVPLVDGALVGAGVGATVGLLFAGLLALVRPDEEVEEIDMEQLTEGDVVTAMLEEFRRFSPGGAEALIDERDAYIAHQLVALREQGLDVVAVVGAGHEAGIREHLANPSGLPPVESLTGTAKGRGVPWFKLVGYAISLGFLSFFVLLAMAGVRDGFLLKVFGAWFLVNGAFAFGLAKLAGARWTSAGVGGAVAWMTSVNPLLAPGWFAGYVELRYTSVNVGDIATLNELLADETRPVREIVGDMFDVPLFRLIMIVAMTNVGSMVATALFGVAVLPWLGAEIGGVGQIPQLMVEGARRSAELVWEAVA